MVEWRGVTSFSVAEGSKAVLVALRVEVIDGGFVFEAVGGSDVSA